MAGEPAGKNDVSSRAAQVASCYEFDSIRCLLYGDPIDPDYDEAARLADCLIGLRAAGSLGWPALRQKFLDEADPANTPGIPSLFKQDAADLASHPVFRRTYGQAKADLAFQAISENPFPYAGPGGGSATWSSWALDADWSAPGSQPPVSIGFDQIKTIPMPAAKGAGWPALSGSPDNPFVDWLPGGFGELFMPQGGMIAPPVRFRIESLGGSLEASAAAQGELWTAETIQFTSQDDFEAFNRSAVLSSRGIGSPAETPAEMAARHDWREAELLPDGSAPTYYDPAISLDLRRFQSHVVTLPRVNRRSIANDAVATQFILVGYPFACGAVTLATREAGHQGAGIYWPIKGDFDQILNNGNVQTNLPTGDFWHETNPAVPLAMPPSDPMFGGTGLVGEFFNRADSILINPLQAYNRYGNVLFRAPGMDAPGVVDQASWEGWFDCEAGFLVRLIESQPPQPPIGTNNVFIQLSREPDREATRIDLNITWHQNGSVPAAFVPFGSLTAVVDDDTQNRSKSWANHIVVTFRRNGGSTDCALYVNGQWAGQQTIALEMYSPAPSAKQDLIYDVSRRFDEIRMYNYALSPDPVLFPPAGEIANRYSLDRFVRQGIFTSPLCVFDAPAALTQAQWTGFTPVWVPPPPGPLPAQALAVELLGYDIPNPALAAPPAWSVFLAPTPQETDLASLALAPVRSFRYKVHFDCRNVAGALTDTPVFESIRFAFHRPGRVGWSSWAAR